MIKMMKSIIKVVFFLVVLANVAFAAVSRGQFNDPKHPGKCTIKENLVLNPGQQIKDPDADCARIICGEDGFAEFQTCGKQIFVGCTLGDYVDKTLPYPDCCERVKICSKLRR